MRITNEYISAVPRGWAGCAPSAATSRCDGRARAAGSTGALHEVWSIDFVMHALPNGHRLKCPTIVDDFTKETIESVVDHGISSLYVARELDHSAHFRDYGLRPEFITLQRPKLNSMVERVIRAPARAGLLLGPLCQMVSELNGVTVNGRARLRAFSTILR